MKQSRPRTVLSICVLVFCLMLQPPAAHAFAVPLDLRGIIQSQLAAGKKRVVVPPLRYEVEPSNGVCLNFKNLTNVDILADGAEMDCAQTSRAINFENCRNVHLKGLTIDYDPLPFTEARISALAPDKSWMELEVIPGYPQFNSTAGLEIFDPATGTLRRETGSWRTNFDDLGHSGYRIYKPDGYRYDSHWDYEEIGDILVANCRSPRGSGDHAVVASHCGGLKLEDVTLYASPAFGFLEYRCDGSTYLRCKVDRRPESDEPHRFSLRRFRSLNADAFHSIEAAKGPAIIGCTARFQGDDCVNIHGIYHMVMASHGNQLRVAAMNDLSIAPNDAVEFIPYQGARPPDGRAVKIEPDGALTADERKFIQNLPLDEHIRRALLGPGARFFKITLNRPVSLPMGSGICARNRVGNGCVVRDCDFGSNRSRGIIIKASRAKVTGNKITGTWMTGVLVAPEFFWWLEAACPEHVRIEDNIFDGCRGPAIEATARGGDGQPLPAGALRDIIIQGNTVAQSAWPNIHVTSAAGLVLRNNRLTPADGQTPGPPLSAPWQWGTNVPTAMFLEK